MKNLNVKEVVAELNMIMIEARSIRKSAEEMNNRINNRMKKGAK